jgi:hypothetical protein
MTRLRRFTLIGLAVCLATAAAGCGRGPTVSGRVTYRGAALTNGGVMFHGADGSAAYGGIGADGSYTVRNAPTGPVRITVNVPPAARLPRALAGSRLALPAAAGAIAIPARYGRPESSGLTCVVEEAGQEHDIDLH